MSNNTYRRQTIANLECKLIEIQVRIEEIALVFTPSFENKVLAMLLSQEMFLSCCASRGQVKVFAYLLARAECAFGVYNCIAIAAVIAFWFPSLFAYSQNVYGTQQRAIEIWFVGLYISIKTRIDPPFHNTKRLVEQWRKTVANRVVEVVAEDEFVAFDVLFGREGEGDGVAIVRVQWVGEVWGCGW
jgi:hypothetical protein